MKLDPVTQEFVDLHKKDCSNIPLKRWQISFYLIITAVLVVLLQFRWDYFLFLITAYFAFLYFCAVLFRFVAVVAAMCGYGEKRVGHEAYDELSDDELTVYTIFLPLYKEANIAGKIIKNMEALDYPKHKLDIKLLLEADDDATIKAVKKSNLPDYYDVIIVPDFLPKTKPRACNYGLKRAKGTYCVIYDAEDRPEPDQLKKVISVFNENQDPQLVCVQAKLNYYNPKQNWLTRFFTIEYSTTFDLFLPGLELFNIPIPLGGTSNHFRTDVLQDIGGWDPFNVTEDCDLGIRIYKRRYKTTLINSTTWEEANSQVWNWVRQRSRWVKGFFQTHFTHMRHPLRTFCGLGPWGFFGFYLTVGASSFMMLINVFYWVICSVYLGLVAHAMHYGVTLKEIIIGPHQHETYQGLLILGSRIKAWPLFYTGPTEDPFWSSLSCVFFAISVMLFLANGLFVFSHLLACLKRKYYFLIPFAFLMPFYWVLISIGAWKGFMQLFTKPFYWEKTNHGLDDEGADGAN